MSPRPARTSPSRQAAQDIRVMVVDDAAVVRSLLSRWIGDEPGLSLVAAVGGGREALERLKEASPDVVVLDVDMPDLDGLATLPLLLQKKRDLVVIMASTLTRQHAEIGLKALALGATDCIPKPDTEGRTSVEFQRELIGKIRALGAPGRKRPVLPARRPFSGPATRRLSGAIRKVGRWRVPDDAQDSPYNLRGFAPVVPRVLLIGASTGGPQALSRLVARLDPVIAASPVLITQHMPATFTAILAENLSRACGRPVREGVDGEPVVAGTVYLAPGGRHMRVTRRNGSPTIVIDDGAPVNFCKPAIDPLFSSAAEVWGPWNLAVILTGMGHDGTQGAADIANAGGNVIAQDEATSTIWGMPGAAVQAGVCSAVLPLDQIGPRVVRLFLGARS